MALLSHTTRAHMFAGVSAAAFALCAIASPAQAKPTPPKRLDTKVKEPQVFRYKYTPKADLRYTIKMRQEMNIKAANPQTPIPAIKSTSDIDTLILMNTKTVHPNGIADIETTYETFDIKLVQNGTELPKKNLKPVIDMVKEVRTFTSVTPRGETRKTDFKNLNPAMKQMTEALSSSLVGLTPTFPDKGLRPGEGWTQNAPLEIAQGPVKLTIKFNVKYTFMGLTNIGKTKVAVFKSDLNATINEVPGAGPGGAKMNITGTGKGLGYLYFDLQKGRMLKSEMEMNQNTRMKITMPEDNKSQALNMSQFTSTKMGLKGNKRRK